MLEAVTAAAVTNCGQPPPAADVRELAAMLRQTSTAVRSGTPVQPAARLPRAPSLEQVSDALRSLQDALAGTLPDPRVGMDVGTTASPGPGSTMTSVPMPQAGAGPASPPPAVPDCCSPQSCDYR